MVKLTLDLISRGTSGYTKKKRDEGVQHYLRRLTHLYLEGKNIDEIGDDLSSCRNLTVLYLYDNKLTAIPNLLSNGNLTHLYLQNNKISKIENLKGLQKLQKLYLGGNAITVVEGLDKLQQLQELHLENQKLSPGEKLLFDPRTLAALSTCVHILNISGNAIDSIRELEILAVLTQFIANDNNLNDMKEVAYCLSSWRYLYKLELIGNPLCHKTKYKDRIIIMSPNLGFLDGKEVSDTEKQFLQNWQANKEARRKRELVSRQNEDIYLDHEGHNKALPSSNGTNVRQIASVPGYIMPGLPRKQFQDVLAKSTSQPSSAVPGPRLGTKTYSDFAGFGPPRWFRRYKRPVRAVYHIFPETLKRSSQGSLIHIPVETYSNPVVF